MIRKHIYYSGHVQGVGFRFTAVRVAGNYAVAGFVRNMPDGRVEMVIEGSTEQVKACISALAQAMDGYIRNTTSHEEPYEGTFKTFDVRF